MGQGLLQRIGWTAGLGLLSGLFSYLAQRVLRVWGVFDPVPDAIGAWLKVHVTADQVGWTAALIFTASVYGWALWIIWHSQRSPSEALADAAEKTATSIVNVFHRKPIDVQVNQSANLRMSVTRAIEPTPADDAAVGHEAGESGDLSATDSDLDAWRQVDPLTLRDAACLIGNKDPSLLATETLRGAEAATLQALKQASQSGQLGTHENPNPPRDPVGPVEDYALVNRKELAYWAERRGRLPPFLEGALPGPRRPDQRREFKPPEKGQPESALWVENVEFVYEDNPEGRLERGSLVVTVANRTDRNLEEVSVAVSEMWRKDTTRIAPISSNRLRAPEDLAARETIRVTILTRDVLNRGSWMLLNSLGQQPLSADEGTTFKLGLIAKGEPFTRAYLSLALRNGRDSYAEITDQFSQEV